MAADVKPIDAIQHNTQNLRLWLRMLKAKGLIEAHIRKKLRENFETTLPRFDVMSVLIRYPAGVKMSQISRHLRVSNGNTTGIVDRLIDEGNALRISQPGDRRAYMIRLTPGGKAAFEKMADAHQAWIDQLMHGLDESEVGQMIASLETLVENLERKVE